MKCFIRSESKFRGLLPAPRGLARRGSATWGLFTWLRVVPCGPFSRGAAQRGSSVRGLLHVPPTLPCALLAAVLLHVGVLPATLLPEHCIIATVRRGRAGQVSAARPAGFGHSLPCPARLGRLGKRICQQRMMLAATLLKCTGNLSSRHNRGLKPHGRSPSSSEQ